MCFELDSVLTQTVQTDVAVCYHKSKKLYLAIPVEEPVSRDVEALVLSSTDGVQFDGYKAARWGRRDEVGQAGRRRRVERALRPGHPGGRSGRVNHN